jgi:hypothetical protein
MMFVMRDYVVLRFLNVRVRRGLSTVRISIDPGIFGQSKVLFPQEKLTDSRSSFQ